MLDKSFDAAARETAIYEMWEAAGAFAAGAGAKPGAETFSMMIPPPNVTGNLHMGHAFNNTLQDVLARWHRMQGHDTLWQPGTDHAGIATQMVVERELAKEGKPPRREMKREDFLKLVWEQKSRSRGNIIGQLKRLGASCDWSREAFTMGGAPGDPETELGGGQNFHDAVIRVFVDMYEKGLIYRGKRLVNWDPHFETAISDLEVENVEVPGHMWHFKYPLAGGATYEYVERDEDGTVTLTETRDYISIATTRPETMLGDGAVAVHPSDERYASIVGTLCEIPVGPKETRRLIPIITDEYPDKDFGSGAVKITGAHDFNDYGVATRNGIPLYRLMDTKAAMRTDGLPYAEAAEVAGKIARGEMDPATVDVDTINLVPEDLRGLDRYEARVKVVEQITAEGLAVMVPETDPRLGSPKSSKADPADGVLAPEEGGEARAEVPLVEAKPIVQPHGDRSKTVIEPMLTDQWFVDAAKIVGPAIEEVRTGMAREAGATEGTRILPEQDAKVYFHWLENIEPWTISRQLWWGHRIPVWYGPEIANPGSERVPSKDVLNIDGKAFCAPNADEAAKLAQEYYGPSVNIEKGLDTRGIWDHEKLPAEAVPGSGGSASGDEAEMLGFVRLDQDPDVLDTWFSSGLWPIGTLGWTGNPEEDAQNEALQKYFPTSVLVTGFDIIFFWVARMMMMQHAVVGQKPFETVYVHALVRDEKGKKMSKSLGNVIDPLDLVDEYGADAVRFTLAAMAAMGRDLKLSTQRVAGYRNFGNKLWNAAKFAQMNEAWDAGDLPDPATLQPVNAWIVGETARAAEGAQAALTAFRFNDAANGLYAFTWNVLCDWYLELSKPLLMGEDDTLKAETRATLAWVMDRTLALLHPFMPFVTEEIWQGTAERPALLCLSDWPDLPATLENQAADAEIEWVIALIEAIRSSRGEMGVPAGAKLPLLKVNLGAAESGWLDRNLPLIQRLARVTEVQEAAETPKGAVTLPVGGGLMALPLAGVIDVAAETARLQKAMGKLGKELNGLRGRLKNPKFAQSAPADVVEETKSNLALREAEEAKITAALARLGEMQ